jgi:hypothetical protein
MTTPSAKLLEEVLEIQSIFAQFEDQADLTRRLHLAYDHLRGASPYVKMSQEYQKATALYRELIRKVEDPAESPKLRDIY